ncbi:MAG: hypoxanthine phosphoribosyltransferase [Sphaerospermopsis sp. SIO1G2]|nr:hypoxanthine phosphoribosyltransferase [Sphaerospermopsis sp. SIO1G2]
MTPIFTKPADYRSPESIPVLYDAQAIHEHITALAGDIHAALGAEFLVVGLLKGSFIFAADLVRALHHAGCTPQVDFMTLSSYGAAKQSSGAVQLEHAVTDAVAGKPVLLVDDILESGRTLAFAQSALLEKGAARVDICVLLDKPGKRHVPLDAQHVGFRVPDRFIVGYGLDYAGYYRELPFIGALD